jgi:hypothetical protein
MYVPSYQQDDAYRQSSYEFRWTIATVAALALCTVALVAAAVLSAAGDRFEYRSAESTLSRHDDELRSGLRGAAGRGSSKARYSASFREKPSNFQRRFSRNERGIRSAQC